MAQIQPAVKKETARVTGITLTGCVIMFSFLFFIRFHLHQFPLI